MSMHAGQGRASRAAAFRWHAASCGLLERCRRLQRCFLHCEPSPHTLPRTEPACGGECLCRQVSLWLLVCFGYALPITWQLLSQIGARQAFMRRRGCREGCWHGSARASCMVGAWIGSLMRVELCCSSAWAPIEELRLLAHHVSTAAGPARSRRHRRCACHPRCDAYVQLVSRDLPTLRATAAVLFVGFCGAAWQAIVAWGEWAAAAVPA